MPVDSSLADVHFRVAAAGASIVTAIDFLRARRVFQGRMAVSRASADLRQASADLKAAGVYPNLQAYVDKLADFYAAEAGKVLRPNDAPGIAADLHGAQGLLIGADPFGPSAPSG